MLTSFSFFSSTCDVKQEEHAWQEERSELESKIELINQAHVQDLENEKVRRTCWLRLYVINLLWGGINV